MTRTIRSSHKTGIVPLWKVRQAVRKVLYAKGSSKQEKVKRGSALSS